MQHFNWKSLKFPELVFINFGLVSNSILSFENWTLNINSVIGVFRYNFCIIQMYPSEKYRQNKEKQNIFQKVYH